MVLMKRKHEELEIKKSVYGDGNRGKHLLYIYRCFGEEVFTSDRNQMVYNLLLEYGSGGTLADVIKKTGGNGLPESDVRRYTRYILEGLDCVHSSGYVHLALKPENIIIVPIITSTGTA
ncbi:Mitogen-activated protein kinase kinase kinase 17 [Camellia lanceoleosa]|uniref:Mitogen-activated protein kinase kinase kinase 17 n=1 Tax=Camellia lanceoleosa TaxID=1840588 RepID=A0ACC0FG00_9ERIC|nr:Mitogen-activated protein kinase kinase kinase 17 [Camellia lanceoleosa]